MTSHIHLNIGSNSGDRRAFIARAVAALISEWGRENVRTSLPVESEPWGYLSPNPFINIGVEITVCRKEPWKPSELEALLGRIKTIERSISSMPHRTTSGQYADREIDIDIIAVDNMMHQGPKLTLPHPHLATRAFVLEPLAQLAPHWRHPRSGLTADQMLQDLSSQ